MSASGKTVAGGFAVTWQSDAPVAGFVTVALQTMRFGERMAAEVL